MDAMIGHLRFLLIFICVSFIDARNHSNVCKTFPDYYTNRDKNPNCYYNPDEFLPEPDIIRRHGYPLEIHDVITKDGYILSLFRIPHGRDGTPNVTGPPVLILPGLVSSSVYFYFRGNTSLGFILADLGYDVWFGNFRGTEFSSKHVRLNTKQRKYWDFSFHELGYYDLAAKIDWITLLTRQKVIYIGISMGTTSFFVYGTERPDEAYRKVRVAICLAPVGILSYQTSAFVPVFAVWPVLKELWYAVTNGPLIVRNQFLNSMVNICLPYPFQMKFCDLLSSLFFGYDPNQLYPEYEPIVATKFIDASSIKTLTHYSQVSKSRAQFRHFDYGIRNRKVYGTSTPPPYRFSRMKVPCYLMRGDNDPIATKKNVEATYALLPPRAKPFDIYVVKYEKFSHIDFVRAKDAVPLAYDEIVGFLRINGPKLT